MSTRRPFALFERAKYLDGRQPTAFVLPATLAGRLDEQSLRLASNRVQARHGVLRSLVERDADGRTWFVQRQTPPPIALRIAERHGDEDWKEQARLECERSFDAKRAPLIRLVWLRGAVRGDLLLCCHHCICDGGSAVALSRDILAVCDRPDARLGPRFELHDGVDVLPPEARRDRRLQRRARWKTALYKGLLRCWRIGPPLSYGAVYTLRWSIEAEAVQALLRRCKQEGAGLFAAVSPAFMLACRSMQGAREVKKFVAPVAPRRYLPALHGGMLFPVAPMLPLSFGRRQAGAVDFWSCARAWHDDMHRRIEGFAPVLYEQLLGLEQLHPLFGRLDLAFISDEVSLPMAVAERIRSVTELLRIAAALPAPATTGFDATPVPVEGL